MTKDEALRKALRELEEILIWTLPPIAGYKLEKATAAIKEALAQPEQDEKFCDANCVWTDHHPDCKLAQPEQKKCENCGEFGECCQAQPSGSVEQEPVAWRKLIDGEYGFCDDMTDFPTHEDFGWEPLYTTPPQRTWVGLRDSQKLAIIRDCSQLSMVQLIELVEEEIRRNNNA